METILRYVARWLAGILETYGDPELQSQLDAYNAKVAAAEKAEKDAAQAELASQAAYAASLARRQELDRLIWANHTEEDALEQELAASQQRIKQIQDEVAKAKADLASRSDADVLRDKL